MITLHLITQPHSTWNQEDRFEGQTDTSLSTHGKKQTQKIIKHFQDKEITSIYTSRTNRAIQVAKQLEEKLKVKIIKDEHLNDANYGLWQGKFIEELEGRFTQSWTTWKQDPQNLQIPNGELFQQIQKRATHFLHTLNKPELFDTYYIAITHDIIIRIILNFIENQPTSTLWKYQLDHGSITIVQLHPEMKIENINYTDHL